MQFDDVILGRRSIRGYKPDPVPRALIEVAPSFGYDEDSFAASWAALVKKPVVADGLYLA